MSENRLKLVVHGRHVHGRAIDLDGNLSRQQFDFASSNQPFQFWFQPVFDRRTELHATRSAHRSAEARRHLAEQNGVLWPFWRLGGRG